MDTKTTQTPHRKVFREEIRSAIKEAIFTGKLQPGSRIIETFWAKELGVSQAPVREAIRDLEAQGLIETIPFKGSRVCLLSEKDMEDNYSVRICLESKSLKDAISKLDDNALGRLVSRLDNILGKMDTYACEANLYEFTKADTQFHKEIILATGNRVLLSVWEQCNMRMWFLYASLADADSLKQLQLGHKQLFAAICKRDKKAATEILEDHIAHLMEGFTHEK